MSGFDEPRILEQLRTIGLRGSTGTICCPAHDDKSPSLSVGLGDDNRVLLRCFAGCETSAIAAALGATMADLFPRRDENENRRAPRRTRTFTIHPRQEPRRIDFPEIAARARESGRRHLPDLARQLGVSVQALTKLGAGWGRESWLFPMSDADGTVVGFRVRWPGGRKTSVPGSRQGLFLPAGLPNRFPDSARMFLPEGPSDVAALLDLGLLAVGRPSCSGGADMVRTFVHSRGVRRAVVFADADEPGRAGALALARHLMPACRDVRIIEPQSGFNDVREWVRAGATAEDVLQLVAAAKPLVVKVEVRCGV